MTMFITCVIGAPHDYKEQWSDMILRLVEERAMAGLEHKTSEAPCGRQSNVSSSGNMWFTAYGCRVAAGKVSYVNQNGSFAAAEANEIIDLQKSPGEAVYWPSPSRTDCYYDGSLCGPDEWCMTERHEKWGPWAETPSGQTADAHCTQPYFGFSVLLLNETQRRALNQSIVDDTCGGVYCENGACSTYAGSMNAVASLSQGPSPWRPVRGQCVKYRKKNQSCYMTFSHFGDFYRDAFIATTDPFHEGGSIERPMVCAPGLVCTEVLAGIQSCVDPNELSNDATGTPREENESCGPEMPCKPGLVCTGPELQVLNSTCVKPRPPDLCFAGPWWDSTSCPRSGLDPLGNKPPCGGMTYAFALESLYTTMLLSPGEIVSAGSCSYWFQLDGQSSGWAQRTSQLRRTIYDIFDTLWPRHIPGFEVLPTFDMIEREVYAIPYSNASTCVAAEQATCTSSNDSQICHLQDRLAYAGQIVNQPCKVWSLIHWVMANLLPIMTEEQVHASQSIALVLRDNFWCNDCRGFFTIGVLGEFGYPPSSRNSIDHERYWNLGHNQASEHVATTRGGHPWMFQLANQTSGPYTASSFQNPFFMPFECSHHQWKQDESKSCKPYPSIC